MDKRPQATYGNPKGKEDRLAALKKRISDTRATVLPESLKLEEMDIRQWHASIMPESAELVLEEIENGLLPWVRISEKLNIFIHMQASAITSIKKSGESSGTVRKLTERVAPVISIKENVDEYLSAVSTRLLEKLEEGEYELKNQE